MQSNPKEEQKSDFTFVLSNKTDYPANYDCTCAGHNNFNNNDNSFLTNKHQQLTAAMPSHARNSELKSAE